MNYYILPDEESLWKNKIADLKNSYNEAWKRIGEAAGSNCDWHDNFEFDDAQRAFHTIGEKLKIVQDIVSWAQLVGHINMEPIVAIGKKVTISLNWWPEQSHIIWGYDTPVNWRISYSAPLIRILLWKTIGDVADIILHWKKQEVEILDVTIGVNLN